MPRTALPHGILPAPTVTCPGRTTVGRVAPVARWGRYGSHWGLMGAIPYTRPHLHANHSSRLDPAAPALNPPALASTPSERLNPLFSDLTGFATNGPPNSAAG